MRTNQHCSSSSIMVHHPHPHPHDDDHPHTVDGTTSSSSIASAASLKSIFTTTSTNDYARSGGIHDLTPDGKEAMCSYRNSIGATTTTTATTTSCNSSRHTNGTSSSRRSRRPFTSSRTLNRRSIRDNDNGSHTSTSNHSTSIASLDLDQFQRSCDLDIADDEDNDDDCDDVLEDDCYYNNHPFNATAVAASRHQRGNYINSSKSCRHFNRGEDYDEDENVIAERNANIQENNDDDDELFPEVPELSSISSRMDEQEVVTRRHKFERRRSLSDTCIKVQLGIEHTEEEEEKESTLSIPSPTHTDVPVVYRPFAAVTTSNNTPMKAKNNNNNTDEDDDDDLLLVDWPSSSSLSRKNKDEEVIDSPSSDTSPVKTKQPRKRSMGFFCDVNLSNTVPNETSATNNGSNTDNDNGATSPTGTTAATAGVASFWKSSSSSPFKLIHLQSKRPSLPTNLQKGDDDAISLSTSTTMTSTKSLNISPDSTPSTRRKKPINKKKQKQKWMRRASLEANLLMESYKDFGLLCASVVAPNYVERPVI